MGSHRLDIGHIPASVIVITLTPTIKMFSRFQKPVSTIGRQLSTSSVAHRNVAVMGASGGIGQPLSMLLKLNPAVTKLALYDIVHTPGLPPTSLTLNPRLRSLGSRAQIRLRPV